MTFSKFLTTRPSFVRRLSRRARAYGYARVFYSVLQRVITLPGLRHCGRLCAVDVFRIDLSDWQCNTRIPGCFEVRWASVEDRPALFDYFGDCQRVHDRFERGDLCALTLCRGEISAAVWISVGPNVFEEDWAELRCSFVFPVGVAWIYDGKGTKLGAWGSLMASLPGFLDEVGACQVATVVDVNNWNSLNTQRSLGFENIGWVACLALGPFVRSVYKPRGGPGQLLPHDTGRLMLRKTHRPTENAVEPTDVTATSLK